MFISKLHNTQFKFSGKEDSSNTPNIDNTCLVNEPSSTSNKIKDLKKRIVTGLAIASVGFGGGYLTKELNPPKYEQPDLKLEMVQNTPENLENKIKQAKNELNSRIGDSDKKFKDLMARSDHRFLDIEITKDDQEYNPSTNTDVDFNLIVSSPIEFKSSQDEYNRSKSNDRSFYLVDSNGEKIRVRVDFKKYYKSYGIGNLKLVRENTDLVKIKFVQGDVLDSNSSIDSLDFLESNLGNTYIRDLSKKFKDLKKIDENSREMYDKAWSNHDAKRK
jgi:hypothetical protein